MRLPIGIFSLLASALLATPALAAQLLTDGSGYAGPVIDIGIVPDPGYYFSDAPQVFGAVTVKGTWVATVYGQPYYGFGDNGGATASTMIATGYSASKVTIRFATPVAAFGGGFNYAPGLGQGFPFPVLPPTLSAYDRLGGLIARYDLSTEAPIDAGGQTDYFAFRGIDGGGVGISRFVFSGSYIGLQVVSSSNPNLPPAVPEPAVWSLLIAGFGAVGGALRGRRQRAIVTG